jgi:hypothetical protein
LHRETEDISGSFLPFFLLSTYGSFLCNALLLLLLLLLLLIL